MMRLLGVALALLAGCGGEVVADATNPAMAARPDQARAFEIVKASFARGMRTEGLLEDAPSVRWSETVCPAPAADGSYKTAVLDAQGRCFSGLTYEGCDIRIAWRGTYSASAFSHEIMHCLLDRAGTPDPDHTLDPAAWALVAETDGALARSGL